ncbi:MAG: hypothetical protein AB8G99_12155, partial [Planctomycetaceae bacterium]
MHLRICGLFLLVCGLGNEAGVGQEQLTASQIADQIENVAKQYRSVRYSTIFNVTKSANPFKREENPKLVTGNGRTSYTRQGEKWVVDLHSFTLSMNSGKKTKTHTGGGFDGGLHWHRDADEVTLAEEFGSGPTYDPSELFWHGARNRGWLLAALRKDSAKVVGTELVEGQECLKVESEFKDYRFRFSIAPNAAFLPLRSECAIKGHVQGVETLSQLRQSESGLWYPGRIRIEHPDLPMPYVVKRIAVRALESADDVLPEVFQPKQPFGLNVVDHRRGFAFHNDPWWSEMEPILREQFSWPRADLNALQQLSSYEAESGGKPVPKVHAAEWINGDPGEWNREGRNVTVVWFYGGRAIIPSPKVWS